MAVLPTNYLDDILAASMGGKRRFRITHEDGSTEEVTLEDVSEYEQVGSPFGSGDVNKTNQAVNEKLDSADVVDPALATVLGFAADAKLTGDALSELNKKIQNFSQTLSLNDCSALDEIFETIFNNLDKVCYISCGDNNENSAKTALSINTGWVYATAYAEIVSQRCIRFSVFAMGANNTCYRPKIGYLYNNTTKVVWTSLE